MKIILTHGYFLQEDEKELQIMKPYVPLGILCVAAYLEEQGFPNTVFDSTFQSFDALEKHLLAERPDVVAVYVNLMTKLNVLKIIRTVKQAPELQHTRIVLGGPEVKNHIPRFMESGADFIVSGEGEETMTELVTALQQKQTSFETVKGLSWKNAKGETITNETRELLKNIDQLPFPARKKVDLQFYFDAWKERHGYSMISVSTMRGCPYTCKWCSRAVYGLSYRRRSPKLVVDEIAWIQENYTVDMLWFVDDVFTVSHKWLRDFCDELKRRNITVKYEIITRADRMNEEVIQLLVQSGCFRVWIGAESGSQKIIDAMDRRVDVQQVREMIRLTRRYGVQAGTFIMLGYPGETRDDIRETIHHLVSSDPDLYTLTIAYPIKGTELYGEVEDRFITDLDWASSTDRDIDFKRTYPRRFYEYAVRWVYNEVQFHKSLKKSNWLKLPVHKTKSVLAQAGMWWAAR
jgi:radical SAM superfamily enzyme YgiQ (UPF0313 family)